MEENVLPKLLLTAGEPAGIGPDLCIQIAQTVQPCQLTVIADRDLICERARYLKLPIEIHEYSAAVNRPHQAGSLSVWHIPINQPVVTGKLDSRNAAYVLETLKQAANACLGGDADAMVTAPVHKSIISESGIKFSGHTEFLSELTHSRAVMMLVGGGMRVTLATTHLPLKDVSAAITSELLEQKLRIIHHDLIVRFRLEHPCIAVAGLNPHAGESGHLGREEIDVIIPVLEKLRTEGMNLLGPLPADTLFLPYKLKQYDCILAMYHDQGLPVLKHASFGRGVNVSLGLPIIRTSVDHGTALDLAGTGQADFGSMQTAIDMALDLASKAKLYSISDAAHSA